MILETANLSGKIAKLNSDDYNAFCRDCGKTVLLGDYAALLVKHEDKAVVCADCYEKESS